jgi:MoaA/NifB/PqqE/SkfB family radical SAM enzyme
MQNLEPFSIYNHLPGKLPSQHSPLRDLMPEDSERGWHVARHPLKPLNHLDLLRRKEEIATELGLHNVFTPSDRFDGNYSVLMKHQAGQVLTVDVIKHLAGQLHRDGKGLSETDILDRLREYATVPHMEFHPSDACNLACCDCTYAHDDPERKPPPISFPFLEIHRIASMKPQSMVIIGGGEPVLYRSSKYRFQDMVEEIRATNPGIRLALVTNGTYKPPGDWPDRFSWIRLSLDAATADTYTAFRGKPLFRRVVRNYLDYLDHRVRYVGVSFLFARSNVQDYAALARFIFDLVKREKPEALPKVNVQYRPLRRDPVGHDRPFTQAVTPEQIQCTVGEIRELADSSRTMKAFLRDQTNITAILGGNTHPPHEFSRCFYSQAFRIVRANGELRPCFIRVSEPDFVLGNIRRDALETVALNSLYVGARQEPNCDPQGCRQCHVNYTFEQGLKGDLRPSTSPEVLADPMY